LMKTPPISLTYTEQFDTFRIGWLVGLCSVSTPNMPRRRQKRLTQRRWQILAVVLHYSFAYEGGAATVILYDIQEVCQQRYRPQPHTCLAARPSPADAAVAQLLWTFSIYLEAVAILPQLFLLQRTGEADTLTGDYVFCLVRKLVVAGHLEGLHRHPFPPKSQVLKDLNHARCGHSRSLPVRATEPHRCRALTASCTFSTGSGGLPTLLATRCRPCRRRAARWLRLQSVHTNTPRNCQDWIVWISGFIQTVLYGDFFYYYVKW
jgi:hypothetical protein